MAGPERLQHGRDSRAYQPAPLSQIIVAHSKAAGSSSKRPSKQPPRPQNAWILYRQWALANLLREQPELKGVPQSQLSKRLGVMWKEAGPEIRTSFEQQANIMKEQHAIQHPDYQFRPVKRSVKERAREERQQEKARAKEAARLANQKAGSASHVHDESQTYTSPAPEDDFLPPSALLTPDTTPILYAAEASPDAGPSFASEDNAQGALCGEPAILLHAPQEYDVQPWPVDGMDSQAHNAESVVAGHCAEAMSLSLTPDFLSSNGLSSPSDSLPTLTPLFSATDLLNNDQFYENGMPTLTVADSFNDLCGFTAHDFDISMDSAYAFNAPDSSAMQHLCLNSSFGCTVETADENSSAHSQFDPFLFISELFDRNTPIAPQ